ncbi:hypothetical protein Tco_0656874 [Tanacetum coccineum]|uniref:Transposase MuDR plant domain-containing protein n=1 Tax=Tanacetum coccineum TaxID=301880 RepID=A0ABQ4XAP2_9ASTR
MKNICITIHHEGTFAYNALSYEYGDVDVVENVNLGNCNYERLMKIVKECCLFPVHVEHHGYDVMADGELEMEVVDEELDDEIEMEDVSEYVGLDYVGEEDVEIPNTRLNDTFLNKLVDGKFISDKDFRAKVDTQSSSSRNVYDSSVDDRFEVKEGCSSQKVKQKVVEDIGTPNSKSKQSTSNAKSPKGGVPMTPKSKKSTSKKSQSPKTPKSKKSTSKKILGKFQIKTLVPTHTCSENFNLGSLVTCNWIAKQFAAEVLKNPKISYRQMMVADVSEKFFINDYKDEILSTNPGSSVQLDVDTMDDGETQFIFLGHHRKRLVGFAGVREVLSTTGDHKSNGWE